MPEGNLASDVSGESSEKPTKKPTEEQLKNKSKPKENFLSKMFIIWKRIMFDPEDFFADPPGVGRMLAFVIVNFAIMMFSMFLTAWIIINSASKIYKTSSVPLGSIFSDFIRGFIIGGVIAIVCLFIIAGLTFLMTKIFGNKNNNFISVFDIISAPFAIGVLSPIIALAVFIIKDITNPNVNLVLSVIFFTVIYIAIFYLIYVIVAGLKAICQISGLKASASWVIAIIVFFVALILIFKPTNMPWSGSFYSPYSSSYNKDYNIKGQKDYEDLLKDFDNNDSDYDSDYDY